MMDKDTRTILEISIIMIILATITVTLSILLAVFLLGITHPQTLDCIEMKGFTSLEVTQRPDGDGFLISPPPRQTTINCTIK